MASAGPGTQRTIGTGFRYVFDETFPLFVGRRSGIFGKLGKLEKAMREKRDFQFFHSRFPKHSDGRIDAIRGYFKIGNCELLRKRGPSIQHDRLERDRNRTKFRDEVTNVVHD